MQDIIRQLEELQGDWYTGKLDIADLGDDLQEIINSCREQQNKPFRSEDWQTISDINSRLLLAKVELHPNKDGKQWATKASIAEAEVAMAQKKLGELMVLQLADTEEFQVDSEENDKDELVDLTARVRTTFSDTNLDYIYSQLTEDTGLPKIEPESRGRMHVWRWYVPASEWFELSQKFAKVMYQLKDEGLIDYGAWN